MVTSNNNDVDIKSLDLSVVLACFNASNYLKGSFGEIKKVLDHTRYQYEIILVDDASGDRTVEAAKKIGLTVYVHPKNKGYGGNQKTCYEQALKRNPDIIIMVHPDYQYDAKLTGVLCEAIVNDRADIMLGSRVQTRNQVLAGGMPL